MKKITAIITALLILCSVVVPVTMSATNSGSKAFTNLYNGNTYVEHGSNAAHSVTYDNTANAVIMPNSQRKARINYSTNVSTFEASTVLQGNSSGQIWAGFAFRIQESDFTTATFNTAGYSAYVIRKSSEKNKATVVFRYCSDGAEKQSVNTAMTTELSQEIDLKLRLDVAVKSDNKAYIKLFSANGATQYGNTLEFNLDATTEYTNTAYYEKGAIALISNGVNTFTNLSITTTDDISIPAEDINSGGGNVSSNVSSNTSSSNSSSSSSSNTGSDDSTPAEKLEEKFNLFGNMTTGTDNYTTAAGIRRGTLKTGSANSFSTDVTLRLNGEAETKAGIIFRTSDVGSGNDNMKGYALIVDTTKDDFIRLYLYKYGPKTGESVNTYLGRIGSYITDKNIVLTAGKEIVLHLNVKDDSVEAYIYDKANPTVKSSMLSENLRSSTDSNKDNGEYYDSGAIGFYVASGYFINAIDGFVIEAPEGDSMDNTSSGSTSSGGEGSGDVGEGESTDPLEQKYNLFGELTTGVDKYSTATGIRRGTLKTGSANDFSTEITVKLNAEAETKTGIIFRASGVGTGGNDMQGYALILDTTKDEFIRLYLYKYGAKTGETANDYLGRIGSILTDKNMSLAAGMEIVLHANVSDSKVEAYFYDKANPSIKSDVLSEDLKNPTDKAEDNGKYYDSGAIGFYVAGGYFINAIDGLIIKPAEEMGSGSESKDALSEKYDLYGKFTTESDGYTTSSSTSRGTLKTGSKNDFSTEVTVKLNADGETKTGLIFRVQNIGVGGDNMEGYALILDTTKDDYIRLYLYKYGPENNSTVNAYLGRIGSIITDEEMGLTAGKEIVLHANVVGDRVVAYFYDKNDPEVKSSVLTASLKSATDSAKDNGKYYESGLVGFYVSTGYFINALDGVVIKNPEEIADENEGLSGGIAATDDSKGSASKGEYSSVGNVDASNSGISGKTDIEDYASDFDNYTFYSSSTNNRFILQDNCIVSKSAGAKRAILDGVIVKGFHAAATMKVTDEGTMRSGIVFRINNIENGVKKDGTLAANDIEGYAAILYKTPGTTESYARVVMCVYKYGIVNGKYNYLGTVASKASDVPLKEFEKEQKAAAGQLLTMDVNVIDDQLSMYFYNAANPELKSETLVTELTSETDSEKNTPSLKGVHYKSGAIGLTATDHAIFTKFTVGEPIYPSNEVGDLSDLDSYMIYGSGVKQEGEYITSNSSGTKKVMVKNLTVKDFKASVDMTIDENGNLKSGFFFRTNDMANAADDQTGWAIIVTRNFSTNGETNPNRIDIVLFKWGYSKGKLSYLGEVSREVYKSGGSFVDGKMAGEELTFVVQVQGAGIDATLYKKDEPNNKPVTFSSNLKFAGSKEKDELAYFESGSVGLYLGNSVSDPVNYNRLRNFRIDDGSGVLVKPTTNSSNKKAATTVLGVPVTGESALIIIVAVAFVISAVMLAVTTVFRKKGKHSIGDSEE